MRKADIEVGKAYKTRYDIRPFRVLAVGVTARRRVGQGYGAETPGPYVKGMYEGWGEPVLAYEPYARLTMSWEEHRKVEQREREAVRARLERRDRMARAVAAINERAGTLLTVAGHEPYAVTSHEDLRKLARCLGLEVE
jgi:hypothetical protein